MSYNEHFNYDNCSVCATYTDTHQNYCATTYSNYSNGCSVSHANYADLCSTGHNNYVNDLSNNGGHNNYDDHRNWDNSGVGYHGNHSNYYYCATVYTNTHRNYCSTTYTNTHANTCSVSHNNSVDDCSVHSNYTNHVNYTNPNSGSPTTLAWGSPWSGDVLSTDQINSADGINAIKELRDNLKHLSENKGQQAASVDVAPTSPNVGDTEFNDANGTTPEYVEDNQYDALRDSLNNLWTAIRAETPANVPDRAPGDKITKADWENIKKAADDLAGYDGSAAYANHANYSI